MPSEIEIAKAEVETVKVFLEEATQKLRAALKADHERQLRELRKLYLEGKITTEFMMNIFMDIDVIKVIRGEVVENVSADAS